MSATRYDIVIEQGATYKLDLTYKDAAGGNMITGHSARMQIKDSYKGEIVGGSNNKADFSSPNNGIIVNASGYPNIKIDISAADTATYDFDNAVYDLEIHSGADVARVIEGRVKLKREATS